MSLSHVAITTISVSLLIILVLAVRGPTARRFGPHAAYALWLLPAARLLMPPVPASFSPLGWFGLSPQTAAIAPPRLLERSPDPLGAGTDRMADLVATPPSAPEIQLAAPSPAPAPPLAPAETAALPASEATALIGAVPWLLVIGSAMAASVVLYYALILVRQARFSRLVAMEAEPASPAVAAMADASREALGVRRPVRVKSSYLCSSPMVTGAVRPVVIVPAWFELDYTANEQRLALTHELAHVKRGDLWALHAAHIALALQWFNPLAHLALKAFRADQEAACDALVLSKGETTPHAYGATLLKAARQMRPARQLQVAGLTLDHGLKERFQRMGWDSTKPSWTSRTLAVAAGALLVMGSASTVSAHDEDEALLGGRGHIVIDRDNGTTRVFHAGRSETMVLSADPFEAMHEELAKLDGIQDGLTPPAAMAPPPPLPPVPPLKPMVQGSTLTLDLDLSELNGEIDIDGLDMSDIVQALEALGALESLEALGSLEALADADGDIRITREVADRTIAHVGDALKLAFTAFDEDAFEAELSAFEARMEAFEAEMDAYAEAIEADAERYAAEIEARVEAIVDGDTFERAAEDGEAVFEALAEQCETLLETGERAGLARTAAPNSGDRFTAVCIDPRRPMDDAAFDAFLNAQPELSDADRKALRARR